MVGLLEESGLTDGWGELSEMMELGDEAVEGDEELWKLIQDMGSHEIFWFANDDYCDLMSLYVDTQEKLTKAMAEAMRKGVFEGDIENPLEDFDKVLSKEDLAKLKVPDIVVGAMVTDVDLAERQIKRLEPLMKEAFADQPKLAERVKWQSLGQGKYLTFMATGNDIPWDLIAEDLDEYGDEITKYYREAIKDKQIALAVGIRGNYLILSVGDNLDHLTSLGKGKSLLEHPQLKRIRDVKGEASALTFYQSQRMAENSYTFDKYFQHQMTTMSAMFLGINPLAGGGDPELSERIGEDVDEFMKDLSTLIPESGASVSHTYMTRNGYRGFSQSWAENLFVDHSKRLKILDHVGADPLCVVASRQKYRPQDFKMVMKWVNKGLAYFDEFGGADAVGMPEDEYDEVAAEIQDWLKTFEKTMVENWLPAFKDGQTALVIDDNLKSKQLHPFLPESDAEIRLLEIAVVSGVSDAAKVKKGANEMIELCNRILSFANEMSGGELEGMAVPPAELEKAGDAEYYFYPLGDMLGSDEQISPTAALSKDFMALALSRDHASRLMKSSNVKLPGLASNFVDKEIGSLYFIDFSSMVGLCEEWTDYFVATMAEDEMGWEEMAPMIEISFDFLKCVDKFSGVSYAEGKSVVSEYEMRFRDLDTQK